MAKGKKGKKAAANKAETKKAPAEKAAAEQAAASAIAAAVTVADATAAKPAAPTTALAGSTPPTDAADSTVTTGTASSDSDKVFRIGLVMAGAISAGSYTAGVIDFLLEALDAIADAKAGRDTDYLLTDADGKPYPYRRMKPVVAPPYEAKIAAMSGTSAGAMVTAILGAMLEARVPHITGPTTPGELTGNPLYDCWVEQIHIDKLLGTSDLEGGKPVKSLLNSEPLDTITTGAIAFSQRHDYVRPYVADPLPVYLCVGNMRGVPYSLQLVGSGAGHQMTLHADYLAFELQGSASTAPALQPDRVVLRAGDLDSPWHLFAQTCLASGAFPIGLSSRLLTRDYLQYERREWFIPSDARVTRKQVKGVDVDPASTPESWQATIGASMDLPPLYHTSCFPDGYSFVCVDGGVFNNEPLELCRRALAKDGRNPREPDEAHAAVLLIDPFPDPAANPKSFDATEMGSLFGIAKRLLGVMIAQSRFKPDELALARDPNVASRFAILPSRRDELNQLASPAIACGILSAYGGFLSREFRHHDFMLGRRNCQRFLSQTFVLQADRAKGKLNRIVEPWLDDPEHKHFLLTGTDSPYQGEDAETAALPIIPLLGKLASGDYTALPPWPGEPADIDPTALRKKIRARLARLFPRLLEKAPRALRIFAKIGWHLGGRCALEDRIESRITQELEMIRRAPGNARTRP